LTKKKIGRRRKVSWVQWHTFLSSEQHARLRIGGSWFKASPGMKERPPPISKEKKLDMVVHT
jgi:hypothetical protein